jgi:multidrug efflux pump subunit AcrA (membrane-fusion protein)
VQLVLSLLGAGAVFAYLTWSGSHSPSADDSKRPTPPEEFVQPVGSRQIRVKPGTPLDKKLQLETVEYAQLTAPVLPVTGTALASLKPGPEGPDVWQFATSCGVSPRTTQLPGTAGPDAWQFATPDLLGTFSDWQKAVVDVEFQKSQLTLVKELSDFRIEAQKEVVQRMEKLLEAGTERLKDVVAERVNLKQFEIQGKQDIHQAENAVKVAVKTEATLARQLQQAGLDPAMLRSAAAEGDIVVAEVPERALSRVKLGMTCEVRFLALPHKVFTGKVSSISPVISKDRRTLNVQFVVTDPDKLVRPGMFAEIRLGTDERPVLLVPADGVLHVEDRDYVLIAEKMSGGKVDTWKVVEVQAGELRSLLRFNDKAMANLAAAGLPKALLAKLEPLRKKGFETREQLTAQLDATLAGEDLDHYRDLIITEVSRQQQVEIQSRELKGGETVLGTGAILLKPVVVRVLQ